MDFIPARLLDFIPDRYLLEVPLRQFLFSFPQAAEYSGVPEDELRALVDEGIMRAMMFPYDPDEPDLVQVPRDELDELMWLRSMGVKPSGPLGTA